jgi:hypothetical protein
MPKKYYTQSSLVGSGRLSETEMIDQCVRHFGFNPDKPITMRRDIIGLHVEQEDATSKEV